MATSYTEGKHAAEFVMSEGDGNISRDNITVATSQTVLVGSILAESGGLYSVISATPAAGAKLALALYPVTTTNATAKIAAITNNAEVNGNCLSWPAAFTESEKEATADVLLAQVVKVRGWVGTDVISPSP